MGGFFALSGIIGITCLITFVIMAYYKSQYQQSKHKFSDADVFRLMARANHFLTAEQLAAVSDLNKKEAANRLAYLSTQGIIRRFQDGSGVRLVYQLKEDLPEEADLPISIDGLTDAQIVDAVMEYSKDYQITIAELVIVFGLEITAAKQILKRLRKSGLIKRLWKGFSLIHVVKDPLTKAIPKLEVSKIAFKTKLPKNHKLLEEQVKLKIPDADVLSLAIEHKGRLTTTLLCLKLKISIEEAQIKLDALYEQGAFIMDVNQKDALVEYHLRDKNLLA
jgi:predicted transcriptional regulator